jgi:hypothetical protein
MTVVRLDQEKVAAAKAAAKECMLEIEGMERELAAAREASVWAVNEIARLRSAVTVLEQQNEKLRSEVEVLDLVIAGKLPR